MARWLQGNVRGGGRGMARHAQGDAYVAPTVVIALFYALVAFLVFYRPLFHLTTHVPGGILTDFYHFHWNNGWIRQALTTPGLEVYRTDFVMFPSVNNLAYHTLTPAWFPLWAVFEPLLGTVGAMNLIFALALFLTGYSAFLLFRSEGAPPGWALWGGLAFQVTPFIFHALYMSWANMLGWFWLPVMLLLWKRLVQGVGVGDTAHRWAWHATPLPSAALLGLAVWGMGMTDLQYGIFAGFLLIPYGMYTLVRAQRPARLAFWGGVAAVIGVGLLWFLGPLSHLGGIDSTMLAYTGAEGAYAMRFPGGYITGSDDYFGILPGSSIGVTLIPLTLAALVANGLYRRQTRYPVRWFWLAVALPPLVLSAGATITVFGVDIPMPYRLFHEMFGGVFRFPLRFNQVYTLALLLFIALTFAPLMRGTRRLWVIVGLVLVFVADIRLLRPLDIQPPPPAYDFYAMLGAETGPPYDDYVLLEVPTAAGTGETWVGELAAVKLQYYALTHHKRIINGLLARAPVRHYWYMRTDDPVMSWLGQRRYLEPEVVAAQLRRMVYEWPVGYIAVHQDIIGRHTPTNQEIIGFFNTLDDLLCPVLVERDVVLYRTAWHPDGCPPRTPPETSPGQYFIDIGAVGDERFIGWGWHWPEDVSGLTLRWMGQYPQTHLYVDLPPGEYTLSFSAQAFWEARTVGVWVNDALLDTLTVYPDSLQVFTVPVPESVIGDGRQVTLTFAYDTARTAAEVGLSADERPIALAVDWVAFSR